MTPKAYPYYPGCATQHGNNSYAVSNLAVAEALGFELAEVDDWNCCGATEYYSVNRLPAYALVARNLARAADDGASEMVVPCSACFHNLFKTDKYMSKIPALGENINRALAAGNLHYEPGTVKIRHLLEAILTDLGLEALKEKARRPLYGLKLAAYYGCMIARPDCVVENPEQPTAMDDMIEAIGAKATSFSLKTFCCGGHMTQISEATALEMIHKIVKNSTESGADAIVVICPMCQLNLDVYQNYANNLFGTDYQMPILYFTQVLGLALGLKPKDLGFGQEFVDAMSVVDKIQDSPPPRAKPARRSKAALPMPAMPK